MEADELAAYTNKLSKFSRIFLMAHRRTVRQIERGDYDLVIIGFKVFKEKIKRGQKFRTLRRDKEYYQRLFPGVTLHLYWKPRTKEMELLHKAPLRFSYPTTFAEISEAEARMDGFETLAEMHQFLRETYKDKAETQDYIWLVWFPPCHACGAQMDVVERPNENAEGFEVYQCPRCGEVTILEPASGEVDLVDAH